MKTINLSNEKIYTIISQIEKLNISDIEVPINVGFYISANIEKLTEQAKLIEKTRLNIVKKYSKSFDEEGNPILDSEDMNKANEELYNLSRVEQTIFYYPIKLEDFGDIKLSLKQIEALSFMIEKDEE